MSYIRQSPPGTPLPPAPAFSWKDFLFFACFGGVVSWLVDLLPWPGDSLPWYSPRHVHLSTALYYGICGQGSRAAFRQAGQHWGRGRKGKMISAGILALLLAALSGGAAMARKAPPRVDYKAIGAPLPPFRILRMDSTVFYDRSLRKGVPTAVMIFSPTCDHCEKVLDTLRQQAGTFGQAQFVFVAEGIQRSHMQAFISRKGIAKNPFFKNTGTDWSNLIYFIYRQEMLPQVNVYNAGGRLRHTFLTHAPVDSLRMMLR